MFRYASNSLKKFCGNDLDFPFHNIDIQWLNKYEQWLRNKNCAEVTMSVYFRTLKTAYKKAIDAKCTLKSSYPLDEYRVSKFDISTQKRAISKEAIKRIMSVDLNKEKFYIQFGRDIFIFSYLCAGINFTDIANLKFCNLIDNKLVYIRKKTKKKISTPLSNEALQIIQKYSTGKTKPIDYVFSILNPTIHKTELQRYNRIHKVFGKVNYALKKVAQLTGVNVNLTTYVARHTFQSFSLQVSKLQEQDS